MQQTIFTRFRALVYEKAGIALSENKAALVSSRIGKRMRVLGIDDHAQYLKRVTEDPDGTELTELLDAISTNVTHFFRESDHFDLLDEQAREWAAEGRRRVRLWSAACSTGQEPYSMAMTLLDAVGDCALDTRILATDISTRALAAARKATYPDAKMDDVSRAYRSRFFRNEKVVEGRRWTAREALRSMILFRRLNLSTPPFPMSGPLDMVFCRNVMIYFDAPVRRRLLKEMERLLRPGGYLLLGHAESLTGLKTRLRAVRPSVYIMP